MDRVGTPTPGVFITTPSKPHCYHWKLPAITAWHQQTWTTCQQTWCRDSIIHKSCQQRAIHSGLIHPTFTWLTTSWFSLGEFFGTISSFRWRCSCEKEKKNSNHLLCLNFTDFCVLDGGDKFAELQVWIKLFIQSVITSIKRVKRKRSQGLT